MAGNQQEGAAEGHGRFTLDERLTIENAGELRAQLLSCAGQDADIVLDAANVESVDTAALQVLLAFVRQVRGNGHTVNWQSPSDVLLITATLTGLAVDMGLADAGC
jgi:anti-anti-sigma factor